LYTNTTEPSPCVYEVVEKYVENINSFSDKL